MSFSWTELRSLHHLVRTDEISVVPQSNVWQKWGSWRWLADRQEMLQAFGWMEWKEGNLAAARELFQRAVSVDSKTMDAVRAFQVPPRSPWHTKILDCIGSIWDWGHQRALLDGCQSGPCKIKFMGDALSSLVTNETNQIWPWFVRPGESWKNGRRILDWHEFYLNVLWEWTLRMCPPGCPGLLWKSVKAMLCALMSSATSAFNR